MGKRGHRYTSTQRAALKQLYLEALRKSAGVMTPACEAIGVERVTIYRWRKEDPEFNAACDEILDVALDLAESALLKQIQKGDTKAIEFFLRCKGKSRGYDQRQEFDINAVVTRPRVVFEGDEDDAVQD